MTRTEKSPIVLISSFQKARAVPFGTALHPFAEAIRGLDGSYFIK